MSTIWVRAINGFCERDANSLKAYKASTDMQQELEDAVNMFQRSTMAVDHISPALEFVVLQTGAKMYGWYERTDCQIGRDIC